MTEKELKNGHIVRQVKKLKNKEHQLAILAPILMDENLWDLMPHVEYWIKIKNTKEKYRIDLYYPQIGLAIEVNEKYHKSDQQAKDDKKREINIKNELQCDFYHVDIYEDGFIHIDAINKLKKELRSRVDATSDFQDWTEKSFKVEDALKDHPELIFVNKGKCKNSFPSFQLKKEFRDKENLKIAILIDSLNQFENKNLKAIDCVYDVTYLNGNDLKSGFVEWSGTTTSHSIQLSGETILNLTNNSYHNYVDRNQRRKNKRKKKRK
ncbi:AbaSI family restriction endonuclease [Carboxylicivirga taeanensis]|uniref:AbaSI family restriction endonuclease n=1 Tax=Carboxylicivirga taeanensis TaxID=1416875 RepID=UPI003F6E3A00